MIQAIIVCLFGLLLPSMMMASSFFEEDAIAGYRLLFAIKTAATKPQPIERALKTNMETGKIYVYPSARFFIPAMTDTGHDSTSSFCSGVSILYLAMQCAMIFNLISHLMHNYLSLSQSFQYCIYITNNIKIKQQQ